MSAVTVRALRAALVVPLLAGSALLASAGHASASIDPANTDRQDCTSDFGPLPG